MSPARCVARNFAQGSPSRMGRPSPVFAPVGTGMSDGRLRRGWADGTNPFSEHPYESAAWQHTKSLYFVSFKTPFTHFIEQTHPKSSLLANCSFISAAQLKEISSGNSSLLLLFLPAALLDLLLSCECNFVSS